MLGFQCWVGFPLVGVIVAYSSVQPQRLTVGPSLVAGTGSGPGVSSSCSVWAQQLPFLGFKAQAQTKHGLSCLACGILLDEELNLCLLHWQTDFLPLSHQGSPDFLFLFFFFLNWDLFLDALIFCIVLSFEFLCHKNCIVLKLLLLSAILKYLTILN